MKIKVKIDNRLECLKLLLDTEKSICKINNITYNVDINEVAFNLYCFVCNWPQELKNEEILDGENYKITVETETETNEWVGINSFPINYKEFKEFIYNIVNNKSVNG